MRAEVQFALRKYFKDVCSEIVLAEGEYDVHERICFDIIAQITREPDYERTPTVSIPVTTALILCLDKLEFFKRGNFKEILMSCMTEALKNEENPSILIKERVKDIDKAAKHLQEVLGELPKVLAKGRTMCEVFVEEIAQPKPKRVKR